MIKSRLQTFGNGSENVSMVKSIFERNKTREEKITKQNDMGNHSFYNFLMSISKMSTI